MDLRAYYQKRREIEGEIKDPFPVVTSRVTPDGGKPGLKTQVSRSLAAQLIADGKVELADAKEAADFLAQVAQEWQAAEEEMEPAVKSRPARQTVTTSKIRKG